MGNFNSDFLLVLIQINQDGTLIYKLD